jgi:hypothetical protein
MKKISLYIALLVLVLSVLACSVNLTNTPVAPIVQAVPTSVPTLVPTAVPPQAVDAGSYLLTIGFYYDDAVTTDAGVYDLYRNSNGVLVQVYKNENVIAIAVYPSDEHNTDMQAQTMRDILLTLYGQSMVNWLADHFPDSIGYDEAGHVGAYTINSYCEYNNSNQLYVGVIIFETESNSNGG